LHGSSPGENTFHVDPQVVRYSERLELWDALGDLFNDVWPEYNQHGDELNYYWRQLYDVFPKWQFMLVDSETRRSWPRATGAGPRTRHSGHPGPGRARHQPP
jgi:hypothetical protein